MDLQNTNLSQNKIALITGANKGIGFETAKQLLEKGVFVYLGCRDINRGKEAEETFNQMGHQKVKALELDVTKQETIKAAKDIILLEQEKLDILINNAGISGNIPQNALDTTISNYEEVYQINLHGVIRTTQTFIDLLQKSPEPRIVNVSTSLASLTLQSDPKWPAYDYGKYVVYASSKSAMNMYTVHLAYELRNTAIKINAVCPGYTKTDFTNYIGGEVEDAGKRIIKYALIDNDGPTGKFFSEESNPETEEIPW